MLLGMCFVSLSRQASLLFANYTDFFRLRVTLATPLTLFSDFHGPNFPKTYLQSTLDQIQGGDGRVGNTAGQDAAQAAQGKVFGTTELARVFGLSLGRGQEGPPTGGQGRARARRLIGMTRGRGGGQRAGKERLGFVQVENGHGGRGLLEFLAGQWMRTGRERGAQLQRETKLEKGANASGSGRASGSLSPSPIPRARTIPSLTPGVPWAGNGRSKWVGALLPLYPTWRRPCQPLGRIQKPGRDK